MNRGLNYSELFDYLKKSNVKNIFCIGELKDFLFTNLENIKDKNVMKFDDLQQAVDAAFRLTSPGKICLLSPAAASYDQFKNFEDRGDKFKYYIKKFDNKI
jgi:UDP-N-acetylmuramoylalanine--D-glutamate ligase